jgi:hypothetical protein
MIMPIDLSWSDADDEYSRGITQHIPSMTPSGFAFSCPDTTESLPSNIRLITFNPAMEQQWSSPLRAERRRTASSSIVKLGRSRRLLLPDDHHVMCFNRDTGGCESTPINVALGSLVPRISEIPESGSSEITHITGFDGRPCQLTRELGWWIGCVIGNGWVCSKSRVYLCGAIESSVLPSWSRAARSLFSLQTGAPQDRTDGTGAWGASRKISINNGQFAQWLKPMVGHLAGGKHLPTVTFAANKEFQYGMLAGLFDTDGTLTAAKSGRFNVAYTTKSPILCRQVAWLLLHLGIESNFQLTSNNFKRKAWVVYPSVVDFHHLPVSFCEQKRNNVLALMRENSPLARDQKNDIFPLSYEEGDTICSMFLGTAATRKRDRDNDLFTTYSAMRKARRSGYIGRHSLGRIVDWLGERCPVSVRQRLDKNLHWDRVTGIEQSGPMNVLDIYFDDNVAVVGDYGIPAFSKPANPSAEFSNRF